MNPKKKNKAKNVVILVIGVILYFICLFASANINRQIAQSARAAAQEQAQMQSLPDGQSPEAAAAQAQAQAAAAQSRSSSNAYNGVIAQFQVVISIALVLLCKKSGFITGCAINGFNCLFVLFTQVLRANNTNALPGVVVTAITIVIIGVLYYYVSKNDKINSELNDSYEKAIEQTRLLQDKDESLRFLAYYDKLTSLPNRELFMENVNDRINESRTTPIVYIDLDNFRYINDTFGHNLGDDLLVRYAEKITKICGDEIFAAKIGGDEFGLILSEQYGNDEIMAFIGNLAMVLSEPITIRGDVFTTTASFGTATFPTDTRSAEDLFRCAESAMFAAKANGKNQLCFYRG